MKIEKIKKNHKKEIIIGGLILVSIVSAITLVTTRAKYRVTQEIKLATGTVNYKPYDFKIMAMYQQNDSGTYTEINEMPTSGYVVNEEKSYCTTDNKTQVKGKIKTINGNHVISNLKKNDKCYIWFDKRELSKETLLKLNITNIKENNPDFSQVATTDEGIYKVADGMYGGTSYYWRGAVTNNYVKFANKCWRIVRINGDGSIRLIYEGDSCHANGTLNEVAITTQAYNTNCNNSSYVGWTYTLGSQRPVDNTTATESNAKKQTESWFNDNNNFKDIERAQVITGKFCNDRSVTSDSTWSATGSTFYYAVYERLNVTKKPTLGCPSSDIYELKAGAITADEVIYAGGGDAGNSSYYLRSTKGYFTMSPAFWTSVTTGDARVLYVKETGNLLATSVSTNTKGLRPVINLRSDVTFSSGDGTQSNPYVVS